MDLNSCIDHGIDVVMSPRSSCSSCDCWEYAGEGGNHALFTPPPTVRYENYKGNATVVVSSRQRQKQKYEQPSSSTAEKTVSSSSDCRVCRSIMTSRHRSCDRSGRNDVLLRVRKEDMRNARSMIMIAEEKKKTGGGEKEKKKNSRGYPGNDDSRCSVYPRGIAGAQDHDQDNDHDQVSYTSRSSFYTRNIVAPYLGKYVDVPEAVELSTNFLAVLYGNAMASGKIPPSRLKDWKLFETILATEKDIRTTSIGTVVKDYRSNLILLQKQHQLDDLHDPQRPQDHSFSSFTIEFKPKAGYLALTPFVLPQRRHLKYKQSRFVSLQQLQQRGLWTKGWSATSSASMASASTSEATTNNSRIRTATTTCCDETNDTGPIRMSLYDPVKVFQHVVSDAQKVTTTLPSRRLSEPLQPHGEDDGIETTSAAIPSVSCLEETISCLLDNPQNNLRCFVGDVDILSEGEENASLTSKRQLLLDSIFGSSTSSSDEDTHEKSIPHNNEDKTKRQKPQNSLNDLLQEILVHVFTSHDGVDLLSRIHKWQSDLDIIDVDGALLVYDRLVELLKQQHQDGKDDVHIRAQHLVDCITEADLKKIIDGGLEFDDHSDYPSFLSASPFNFDFCRVKGSTLVCDLFDEVQGFQNLVSESYPDLPAEDVLDSAHQKCLDIVGNLNIEGCRFLLQNWLLSLMMCDISIFILLQSTVPPTAADLSSNMKKNSVKLSDGLWYEFQLRVIDTDQKPSSKIPRKREKEKAFD